MNLSGKKELVLYEKNILPIKRGYSIGTVYEFRLSIKRICELYNVGYCPATKEFYYNRNIHLPKRLIKYFEENGHTPGIEKEMEELGIYNKDDVDKLIEEYNDSQIQMVKLQEKTLNLKRSLKHKQ